MSSGSLRAIARELIDYAGLFPPAALGMPQVVANYAAYRASEEAWMLGRLIVPAARLDEFERAAEGCLDSGDAGGGQAWRLSLLGSGDPAADLKAIEEFNRRQAAKTGGVRTAIDTVEIKAASEEEIERAASLAESGLAVYVEIPILGELRRMLEAIARKGARAKVRTGGVTAEAFPSIEQLARFLAACAKEGVAFKATAGLHHPLRSEQRLTYEPDSERAWMHGFLNLFFAAAWMRAQEGREGDEQTAVAESILAEESAAAFEFSDEGAAWRGHHLTIEQIAAAREGFSISFGSCSFAEPVEDLRALGLL